MRHICVPVHGAVYTDEDMPTARMRDLEEALAAAHSQLQLRNEEVERANRLKNEFLASMSHELRTPLHTILGFSELLGEETEGPLNPKQKRFVNHIHRDAQHLLQLINDILDLSKVEAGHLQIEPRPFSLEQALDEVLGSVGPLAGAKSIVIAKEIPDGLIVEADRTRVKEVLYNLLSNAVKFTPEQGSIRVSARPQNNQAAISVSDTGVGIAPQEQESIFEAFRQVGATTRGVREGAGLGLAISRRLVEQHGGRIWVESAAGHGSTFIFTLPATAPASVEAEPR
jgi:signal transduction histidine kinase